MLYEEGTKDIPLGRVLAVLVDEEEDIAKFKDYKPDEAPAAAAAPKKEAPAP